MAPGKRTEEYQSRYRNEPNDRNEYETRSYDRDENAFTTGFMRQMEQNGESAHVLNHRENVLEHNSETRADYVNDVVDNFNRVEFGSKWKDRKQTADDVAQATFRPMQVSLDQIEHQYSIDPETLQRLREKQQDGKVNHHTIFTDRETGEIYLYTSLKDKRSAYELSANSHGKIQRARVDLEKREREFAKALYASDHDPDGSKAKMNHLLALQPETDATRNIWESYNERKQALEEGADAKSLSDNIRNIVQYMRDAAQETGQQRSMSDQALTAGRNAETEPTETDRITWQSLLKESTEVQPETDAGAEPGAEKETPVETGTGARSV